MKKMLSLSLVSIFAFAAAGFGQSFTEASRSATRDLSDSNARLDKLRSDISEARIPVSKERSRLTAEVIRLRRQVDQAIQLRDNKNVDLQGLKRDIKHRADEVSYLASLMGDYIQRFETQIHICEVQLYRDQLRKAREVQDDPSLSDDEKLMRQVEVVETALARVERLTGGDLFKGSALSSEKVLQEGKFALIGPIALFSSNDGASAGLVVLETGSPEPTVIPIDEPGTFPFGLWGLGSSPVVATHIIKDFIANKKGLVPVDPTLGEAQLIRQTKETIREHIQKGGVVIYFILGLAVVASIIAIIKWVEISGVRRARTGDLHAILDLIRKGKPEAALVQAKAIKGPVGLLLVDAVENAGKTKDLLEEVLYERLLKTQPRLERFIPFIAVVAATSPLLGLLGTVTGMIKTFKLITVFGTGDARSLSSGISEALVTTEFGLLVAIPALIIHAMLLRRTKGVLASMEQTAVAFKNGLETKVADI